MFKIKDGLQLFNKQTTVRYPSGNYGSFEIDGGGKGNYEGFSIGGRVTFMHDNGTASGLYDDVNNKWMLLAYLNGETRLYHSGTQKLATKSGGVTVNGTLTADSLVGSINYNQISNPPSIPDGNLYVRKSGDTMSGQLTVNSDLVVTGDLKMNGTDSYIWSPPTSSGYTGLWDQANARLVWKYQNNIGNVEMHRPLKVLENWGDGQANFPEAFSIQGTYPSYTLRSTNDNAVWLHHMQGGGALTWYYGVNHLDDAWQKKLQLNTDGNLYHQGTNKYYHTGDFAIGNYYTKSEADSRFVNVTGDTMTGALTLSGATDLNFVANSSEDAGDIVWKYNDGTEKHRIWDGGTGLNYRYNGGSSQRIYHQAYHPEADKWTTARTNTVTLTGDASGSGSASVDGTGNWTVSVPVVVNNDSHTHQEVFIPDTRGAARAPSYYPDRYVSFDFQNNSDTAAGGDSWHVLQTIAPWSAYDNSHRQQQLVFAGTGGVKFRYATSDSAWAGWQRMWTSGNDGSGSGLDADLLDGVQGSSFLRSDTNDIYSPKRLDIGSSTNWDSVSFGSQTNVHFQGHNQFWIGAGNGTWFTGGPNSKSQESGLASDASVAHDLLITTMQSTSTYDRGITFGVDSNGTGTFGWRLGKWHSGDARDSSKLVVDGGLFVKGGYTDEYDYYTDDYSAYYSSQGGAAYWGGDSGWNNPSATFSTAIQIQSGNGGTNARQPQLQFHQYGYGGVQFRYSGPDNHFHLESTAAGRLNWFRNKTDHGYIDFGPANSGHAHIYTDRANFYFNKQLVVLGNTVWNSGNDGSGSGLDADLLDGLDSTRYTNLTPKISSGNFNTIFNTGTAFTTQISQVENITNGGYTNNPTGVYTYGSVLNWRAENSTFQLYTSHTGDLVYRTGWNNDGYSGWRRVLNTGYYGDAWRSSNDGSGSGLDADLLDGQHASAFLGVSAKAADSNLLDGIDSSRVVYGGGASKVNSQSNANSIVNSGFYENGGGGSNWPSATWYNSINVRHSNQGNYHGFQLTMSYYDNHLWARSYQGNGTFQGWAKQWSSYNDGSGSGLDADLLDGIQGSTLRDGSLDTNYYVNALYHDEWIRNHYNNNGHYWSNTGWHLYPRDSDDFYIRSGNSSSSALAMTCNTETVRGYFYVNSSSQIGTLNSARSWSFKVDNSGNATATGNVTAYSDVRLKEDIKPLENALLTVTKLKGVSYIRKSTGEKEIGFIAQEVKEIVPELVSIVDDRVENTDGTMPEGIEDLHVMKYQNTVALLVEAIKEQQIQIEDLSSQLKSLKETN